jgi:hypothetical protein
MSKVRRALVIDSTVSDISIMCIPGEHDDDGYPAIRMRLVSEDYQIDDWFDLRLDHAHDFALALLQMVHGDGLKPVEVPIPLKDLMEAGKIDPATKWNDYLEELDADK